MGKTKIEWTRGDDGAMGETWNPVRGCSRVSQGCVNCYAEKVAARFSGPGMPYDGLARFRSHRMRVLDAVTGKGDGSAQARWTGEVRMVPEHLADPLRWKRPRRVFVNSMSDLFHGKLSNEDIAAVFGVMAAARTHTFQVLTKRADRMRRWFEWIGGMVGTDVTTGERKVAPVDPVMGCYMQASRRLREVDAQHKLLGGYQYRSVWPLPNVWLGVSAEDQDTADERIPHLLQTPAAVRFVSYEPALGPVDFDEFLTGEYAPKDWGGAMAEQDGPALDWVIVGGESGPGARPFDVAWATSTIQQCRDAGVAVFCKQLGARPFDSREAGRYDDEPHPGGGAADPECQLKLRDKKGGDMSEWPEDLRVREFPAPTEEKP